MSRMQKQSRDPRGRFAAGDMVRFSGDAADHKASGDFDVTVINPHSNASRVTHYDKRGHAYEGAHQHNPTATVERPARKGNFPAAAHRFEAYHFTLSKNA